MMRDSSPPCLSQLSPRDVSRVVMKLSLVQGSPLTVTIKHAVQSKKPTKTYCNVRSVSGENLLCLFVFC